MCDDWMPTITLPLTWEQFHQLPRHPAYKYEYLDGTAYLSPRSRHYHAELDLTAANLQPETDLDSEELHIRQVQPEDWPNLVQLFANTFHHTQPYGSLDDENRLKAAHHALERTRTGGDGPLIEPASFVALQPASGDDELPRATPVAALFVTLLPPGDPCDWDSYYWTEVPPPDCIERRLGRPHLTWIFVSPWLAGRGLGTMLLAAAVRELLALGYSRLVTTFMIGNDSSMLWHWRNGFRLLSYPGSYRRMRRLRQRT